MIFEIVSNIYQFKNLVRCYDKYHEEYEHATMTQSRGDMAPTHKDGYEQLLLGRDI